jgi:hypothetical protein
MESARVFELVVNGEALSVHRSLDEAMEVSSEVLLHANVFIRSVPSDPATRGPDTAEYFYFDPSTREWKQKGEA